MSVTLTAAAMAAAIALALTLGPWSIPIILALAATTGCLVALREL